MPAQWRTRRSQPEAEGLCSFPATVAQLSRKDGLSWQRYGFAVGQQVTLPNGSSYTITGFKTGAYGPDDTMFLGGGPALGGASLLNGALAVSDYLVVSGTFTTNTPALPARLPPTGSPSLCFPARSCRSCT